MSTKEVFTSGVDLKGSGSGDKDGWGIYFSEGSHLNAGGPVPGEQDGNTGDLAAIQEALKVILEQSADKQWVIKTNSKDAVHWITIDADKWEDNDWKNADGTPVHNQVFIEAIRGDLAEAKQKGFKVTVEHDTSSDGISRATEMSRKGANESRIREFE